MKIFVAVPAYNGFIHYEIVKCLIDEKILAHGLGDDLIFSFMGGDAGIVCGRNQLAKDFMESGFDKLFFLDADISFEPGAICKMAHQPVDFVGGSYRFKIQEEAYPIRWLDDKKDLWWDENKLLEVSMIPTGFLCLSRKVLESIQEKYPERAFSHLGKEGFAYFHMPIIEGLIHGEDFNLCREWKDLGGKIFLDPMIPLTHLDFKPTKLPGHIGNWLKNRPAESEG